MSQRLQVVSDHPLKVSQFLPTEATVLGQGGVRIEPEFGAHLLPIHVSMTGFSAIIGIEIEAIRTDP
jgi:hypothetical protein